MTAGAVLCGGASRRMGTDKALLDVGGVPMAARVAGALASAGCDPVRFVGGDAARLTTLGRLVVADAWPGEGPVGGIRTALDALDGSDVVVAACDLVALDAGTVAALLAADLGDVDAVVATADGRPALLGRWAPSARSVLQRAWDDGVRAMSKTYELTALRVRFIEVDGTALRNVNRPGDLDREVRFDNVGDVVVPEVDIDELAGLLGSGIRLIDVREPDEYTAGHVPGAVSVPLGTVPDHLDAFTGAGRTYVICRSGGRSGRAVEFVTGHGVDAVNVAGGTRAWIESGRDVVAGDAPT